MTARQRAEWLTIAQVCADLQVTEPEWNAWREAGDTPLHIVTPDGQLRIRTADYARWLDSLTGDAPEDRAQARTRTEPDPYAYGDAPASLGLLRPLPAWRRQRIRDVIDAAGDDGLSRTEIWALTSRGYTARQLNHALAELLASGAYEEVTMRTGAPGRPPVCYRRKPSHTAPRDASRGTTAERGGRR